MLKLHWLLPLLVLGPNYVDPVQPPPPPEVRCPDGWNYWNNHCYYFAFDYKTWDDARASCKAQLGSDLASIVNQDENDYLYGVLYESWSNAWLGIHDDNAGSNWYWTDGTDLNRYQNWKDGEPNNNDGNEHCGEIRTIDSIGQWNDMPCDILNPYVCKTSVNTCPESWTLHEGKCYYASNFEATWSEARSICKEFNNKADLVSIHSQDENDFFGDVMTHTSQGVWVGLHYDTEKTNWTWSDGQSVDYLNWNGGEPNNMDVEFCTELIENYGSDLHAKWNNHDCSITRSFGCEFFPTHRIGCEDGWEEFGDYCYFFSNADFSYTQATYGDARKDCQSKDGDLVSIHSAEENDFVYSLNGNDYYYNTWIGMTDSGHSNSMEWSDGTSVTYAYWMSPDHAPFDSSATCACYSALDYSGLGVWDLEDCELYQFYTCKKPKEAVPINPPNTGCKDCSRRHKRSIKLREDLQRHFNHYHSHHSSDQSQSHTKFSSPFHSRFYMAPKYSDSKDSLSQQHRLAEVLRSGMATVSPRHSLNTNFGVHRLKPLDSVLAPSQNVHPLPGHKSYSINSEIGNGYHYPQISSLLQYPSSSEHQLQSDFTETSPSLITSSLTYVSNTHEPVTQTPTHFVTESSSSTNNLRVSPLGKGCRMGDHAYKGSCYNNPGYAETWQDAKKGCNDVGSHLLVINDRFEDAFISSAFGELKLTAWIGLYSTEDANGKTSFSWVNGDPVDFVKWGEYEPAANHGTCVIASGSDSVSVLGLWFVEDCNDQYQYICEYDREGYKPNTPPPTDPPGTYCASGWERRKGRCYKVFSEPRTWPKAENHCASYGGHLTSVSDADEQNVIKALSGMAEINDIFASVWIGLKINDDGEGFMWIDGTPFSYVDWAPGQPNYHHNREDCGSADRSALQYSDTVCETILPYVCEAGEGLMVTTMAPPTETPDVFCDDDHQWLLYNDYCYKFVSNVDDDPQTWHTSHRRCRDDGSELASIHTQEENYWIESKIFKLSDDSMWVGGRAMFDSGYEWLDGTPFDYVNWAEGEPNNVFDQEDCVSLYNHKQGYWNDLNCAQTRGRICKKLQHATFPPAKTTQAPEGHCPQGWIHAGTKCLYFTAEQKTFEDARSACRNLSSRADLVSIHSPLEQAYLTAALEVVGVEMWIGLRNQGGFFWIDQSAVTYTNWAAGEPNGQNNGNQPEDCGMLLTHNRAGQWNDAKCSVRLGYTCQIPLDPSVTEHQPRPMCDVPYESYLSYNGACYKPHNVAKSWQDAETTCIAEGAHLTSVQDLTENAFTWVLTKTDDVNSPWIGLNNLNDTTNEQFEWSDGWPTLFTSWGNDQPNTTLTDHKCVRISSDDGLWFNEVCDELRPFICKHKDGNVPTPDPPATGTCPDERWFDLGGGYCYLVVEEEKPWQEANLNCLKEGSNLVSIHSQQEMDLLTIKVHNMRNPLWIGLVQTREGYGWSDGTGFNFVNWELHEPNSDSEQCVEFYTGAGTWNDADCSVVRSSICKTLKKQVVEPTNPPPPDYTTPHQGGLTGHPLSPGGIVGIVIAVLFVVAAVGFVGITFINKKPKPVSQNGAHGFDNALYSGYTDGGKVAMDVADGGSEA